MATLRLGTRGSALALVQARTVAALLRERAGVDCEIVTIRTSGDRMADARLSEFGGKGLFVKEIEEALLAGTIDLAVHSSKDMPARLPDEETQAVFAEALNRLFRLRDDGSDSVHTSESSTPANRRK